MMGSPREEIYTTIRDFKSLDARVISISLVLMLLVITPIVFAEDFNLGNVIVEVKVPPYEKPQQYEWFEVDMNVRNLNKYPVHIGKVEIILDNGTKVEKFTVDNLGDKYILPNQTIYGMYKIRSTLSGKTKIVARVMIVGYATEYEVVNGEINIKNEESVGVQYALGVTQVSITRNQPEKTPTTYTEPNQSGGILEGSLPLIIVLVAFFLFVKWFTS